MKNAPKINYQDPEQAKDSIELVESGDDYFLCLQNIIATAQKEIHLQTYIFECDETGGEIAEALVKATARNVKVFVLVDAYGSEKMTTAFLENLTQQGINIRFFSPLLSRNIIYFGRRLHHKVIVADGRYALIGGINIANKYKGSQTETPWLDFAVKIENTTICGPLQRLCENIYWKQNKTSKQPYFTEEETKIRILQNDWLNNKRQIYDAYISRFAESKKDIIIVGSYFLPSQRLRSALKKAVKNGAKIKIILSGLSDVPMVTRATKYLYRSLLLQHMELYEWEKSVLHAKLAVVDNHWTTVGSFNLNHLSSFGSIEMNVEVIGEDFAKHTTLHLDTIIGQCKKITLETFEKKNTAFENLLNYMAYHITRLALIISTYIPRKRFSKFYKYEKD